MQDITNQEIFGYVSRILNGTFKDGKNGNFRCYESARIIHLGLKIKGIDSEVKNGIASYDSAWLKQKILNNFDVNPESFNFPNKKKSFLHSWVDLGEKVIDYHPSMKVAEKLYIPNILIIRDKKDIKDIIEYKEAYISAYIFGKEYMLLPTRKLIKLRI